MSMPRLPHLPRLPRCFRALTIALALAGTTPLALAAAPVAKGQAPGWYRMMLGDFEITAISDGTVNLPVDQLLTGAKPQAVSRALTHAYLKPPVETSVNAFLINTGEKLVLVDAGAAGLFGPTLGKLLDNLKASGYRPEQVDEIYITHMHADHVGGLSANGQAVFPNAVVRADRHEGDFWLSPENLAKAKDEDKGFFQGAQASLKPYVDGKRYRPFEGATDLVKGIKAMPAAGHTPGHTIFVVESKGQRLVLWGDLIHVGAVQFPSPSVTIKFDTDPKQAAVARKKAAAEAARTGEYVGAAHLSFPGLGHLRPDGRGYEWLPANYTSGQ